MPLSEQVAQISNIMVNSSPKKNKDEQMHISYHLSIDVSLFMNWILPYNRSLKHTILRVIGASKMCVVSKTIKDLTIICYTFLKREAMTCYSGR